ncbi:MAG: glutamyl-tRNA amidotransferase [Gammaproteobacteria bacterium RIFCSPLOWO2_02_FULL_42_14]|nr:MAG: glutamyl-tRNA amidotransferase [Gammaproteobacteria bacterium RIFCSPHIGHO2_02_FULL_42_43]OGT28097.1 MAG: glutamyl-tRNA amidotransferase [Gammaproteobacteria bacterium RIFCSPHIGHO2_01_FULL_42_8]OGT51211.1 MAG: glutamyl-tRNA amidotransferase [Gammaproteobacteria bacterium RIFCSPHIGHO2_12_FULL_41_25]OGT62972.1 MAG: glutamyl-tRNA amidotransferase [Gammaproteobacteria bacterium RIFCSPLOWO2_02_FULL_42_14]
MVMVDTLKSRIQEDMKSAMRAKEVLRLGTIRLLMAAVKQREIDEQITLQDADILNVINKMIKQRRESIEQFQKASRTELADKEQQEITVLTTYLPEQMTDAQIEALVSEAIKTTKATTIKDMGAIMGIIKPKAQGRADMAKVSTLIKKQLS